MMTSTTCGSEPISIPSPPNPSSLLAAGYSKLTLPSSSPSLPPRPPPPTFRRCVSDLNPSPAKPLSRSSSSDDMSFDADAPNSKRLKRMKDRLKEMSEWCRQLMQDEEGEEEDEGDDEQANQDVPDIDAIRDVPNDTSTEDSNEKELAESVSVEKKDDTLVIHFKCHCDIAYQFLVHLIVMFVFICICHCLYLFPVNV